MQGMGYSELHQRLSRLFPSDRFLESPGNLAPFESDGLTAFAVRPRGVVIPESAAEVIAVVRACFEAEVPFVARGSGTSLSGGSVPHADGIIIALNRLNRIHRLDPQQRLAIVEPGVINTDVTKAADAYGLYYAPDPSSQQICTIGGNLAFNSGGAHCLKYGMTSNHVLGLKAVLADGEVVELGGASSEQVGPDCTGLFVGCEGLFGVAIEITLRLLPRPEMFHTLLAGYASLEDAGDAVSAIVGSGLLPAALEIMDRMTMEAAKLAVGAEYPPDCEAVLIVELDGSQDHVDADKSTLEDLIRRTKATQVVIARDANERAAIWKGRKSAFSAVGLLSPDFIVQDGVVPRAKLGFALRRIGELSREAGIRCANVFHAGDGNLHPLVLYDGREEGSLERAEQLAARIVSLCIELGGSITGEHGVGLEKRQFLGQMYDDHDIQIMQDLRRQMDPREIANRDKMFPSAQAPALSLYGLHPLEKARIASRE